MKAVLWAVPLAALLISACGSRDNTGYRGIAPGLATPTMVPATGTSLAVALGTAEVSANAPGVPPLLGPIQTTSSGLRFIDEQPGTGAELIPGQRANVHYTGWLTDGTKFDSSRDRGQPFEFRIGAGEVIRGWDEGVGMMKIGGKRRLLVPANLAYGERGSPPTIPPDAPLIFDVELLGVR